VREAATTRTDTFVAAVILCACGRSAPLDVRADTKSIVPTDPIELPGPPCIGFAPGEQVAVVQNDALPEISGLALSRRYPDRWYAHNDSGDGPTFYALDLSGELHTAYVLVGAEAVDWEDMAIGPGPDGNQWLYLGDIGDNGARGVPGEGQVIPPPRTSISVYRVPEPPPTDESRVELATWQQLRFRYPLTALDAEALAIDPETGALLLATKMDGEVTEVFGLDNPADEPSGESSMESLATLGVGPRSGRSTTGLVTAMDVHPGGRAVALRTYDTILRWLRQGNEAWSATLSRDPDRIEVRQEPQGEALAYGPVGRELFTTSEGLGSPLWRYACNTNP